MTVMDASASIPSNGSTIVTYMWNFGDTTAVITCPPAGGDCGPTAPLASHVYTSTGSFTITLTVPDGLGLTNTATRTLAVAAVADPIASFTASPNPTTAGTIVNFNGSASSATGLRTIATYAWGFGDGSTAAASALAIATHPFAAGTFTVILTVADSTGAEGQITGTVTVTP